MNGMERMRVCGMCVCVWLEGERVNEQPPEKGMRGTFSRPISILALFLLT